MPLDEDAKKKTLLMIPYGLYILGTRNGDTYNAGTVNWVSQASFKPPLVMVGVKGDSGLHPAIKESKQFALSFLGTGQGPMAYAFFKPTVRDGDKLNGFAFETAETGAPIISDAPAWVECRLVGSVEAGDHSVFVGEVIASGVKRDEKVLTLDELGVKYGG